MNDILDYVKIDDGQAKKDLKKVDAEIESLEAQLSELKQRRSTLNRVIGMAAGELDMGALQKPAARSGSKARAKSTSLDPQKVVDAIKSSGGSATLEQLKDALGVGGRVIGGALRKDDRLEKDADGNYVVKS